MAMGIAETKAVLVCGGRVQVPSGFRPPFRLSRSTAGPGAGLRSMVIAFGGTRVKKGVTTEEAEFQLVERDGGYALLHHGRSFIDEVELQPTLYHSPQQAFFNLDQRCMYHCVFCSSPLLDKEVTKGLTPDRIVEMIVDARDRDMQAVALTSGVVGSPHETAERMAYIVRKVREQMPDIPIGVEPYIGPRGDIDMLKEAGADEIKINMEVWDRELFRRTCPDLDADHIMKALCHAVEVFGRGYVVSNIIIGLGEDDDNVLEAVEVLALMGVIANLRALSVNELNRGRIEEALGALEPVSPERLLRLAKEHRRILEGHGLSTLTLRTMCAACLCCDLVPFKDV